MADARITIGMPVFDNAGTVERAIRSVQAQSIGDWRLIITDDGSSDGSWEIVQAAAAEDARITAKRNESRRMFLNFRASLDEARTEWFVWIAADDYWGKRFLEVAFSALEEMPEAVSALPACRFIDAPGGPCLPSLTMSRTARLRRYLAAPGGTRMYGVTRTSVLKRAFPRRNLYAYDWLLMLGVLNSGPQTSVDKAELFRNATPLSRYVEMGHDLQRGPFRWFPVLDMSLAALRSGHVPWRNLGDLLRLNVRKHEEYVAYMRPGLFARLRPLYALFGLPIATRRENILQAARAGLNSDRAAGARRLMRQVETAPKDTPAKPAGPPRLTALVTCRNAAPTLSKLLDNLAAHEAEVILIDNGSTDETRAIAAARRNAPVVRIVDDPYPGYFDLTRQLRLKRDLIREIREGWIIHSDADEFLDSPDGKPLRGYLAGVAPEVAAFACDELMFLPRSEDERHEPEDFQETMQARFRMIERDRKERVFRASVPLAHWMATGGHTVSGRGFPLSETRLPLRHYFALSLDQVRAEYLSRVYAPRDIAKFWHSSRRPDRFDIVAPPADALAVGKNVPAARSVPVFSPREECAHRALSRPADLALIVEPALDAEVRARIAEEMPSLRVADGLCPAPVPHFHVVAHPALLLAEDDVAGAEAWTRRIAEVRQRALLDGLPLIECRYEDLAALQLRDVLSRLVLGRGDGILSSGGLPIRRAEGYRGRLHAITAALAADLGYR